MKTQCIGVSIYHKNRRRGMKNTGKCTKCNSTDVVKVENRLGQQFDNIKIGFMGIAEVGKYICCDCGFIEDWVESSFDLKKLKERYGVETD